METVMTEITSLIGALGFPIVACIFMGRYLIKITNDHKEEVSRMVEALNKNTLVLQQLLDKFEKE